MTRTDPLARVVFAALVIACFVAFILTQRLKHTPTAVQRFQLTPVFSPTPAGHIKEELLSFKLAHAEKVTVTIIDSAGNTVATLVRNRPVARYKQFSLRWDGRRGTAHSYTVRGGAHGTTIVVPAISGRPAPAGEYRVRVTLHDQHDRPVLSPSSFTLVRK
ncbi:MAG TPA: hypothetical protein VII53_02970 [Solirubrobacteraceae bacterium]